MTAKSQSNQVEKLKIDGFNMGQTDGITTAASFWTTSSYCLDDLLSEEVKLNIF
jgi:hypothetical protein